MARGPVRVAGAYGNNSSAGELEMSNLSARVAARKRAKEIAALARDEAASCGDDAAAFWEKLQELLFPPAPIEPAAVMGDKFAEMFERKYMPYGKYADTQICDVPRKYLDWLAHNQEDPFKTQLRTYLARLEVQAQLQTELDKDED